MVPFSFAGETFLATASDGALFWPAQNALAGRRPPPRESELVRAARPIPSALRFARDADRAGRRRSSVPARRRLYCLGDSFHDRFGCDRLPASARALLTDLTGRLDWTWILGNHDPGFADHCGGTLGGGGRGRRDHPPPRGGARRPAPGDVGPFPPQAAAQPQRPQRLAPLLRGFADQADPAGIRIADRRARRRIIPKSSAMSAATRRRWSRYPTGCCASRSRPRVVRDPDLDRHRPGRRQQQPRDRRAALAEGRRLELVARGVAVELEAALVGRRLAAGRDAVEVGDALIGVEAHHFFKVGSSPPFIVGASDKGQAPRLRGARCCS